MRAVAAAAQACRPEPNAVLQSVLSSDPRRRAAAAGESSLFNFSHTDPLDLGLPSQLLDEDDTVLVLMHVNVTNSGGQDVVINSQAYQLGADGRGLSGDLTIVAELRATDAFFSRAGPSTGRAGDETILVVLRGTVRISADAGPVMCVVTGEDGRQSLQPALLDTPPLDACVVGVCEQRIVCKVPPSPSDATVTVEVSVGGSVLTTDSYTFTHVSHPTPTRFSNSRGPAGGGSLIEMEADGPFRDVGRWYVQLGDRVAPGRLVGRNTLQFFTPALGVAHVGKLAVLLGTKPARLHDTGADFELQQMVEIQNILPTHGAVEGGTPVAVIGGPFRGGNLTLCQFGSEVVQALFYNTSQVVCYPPVSRLRAPSVVELRVSVNGGLDFDSNVLSYEYRTPIQLFRVHPVAASQRGGSTVTVLGANLGADLFCVFDGLETRATTLSSSLATCLTPVHAPANVSFQLTTNHAERTPPLLFEFQRALVVSSILLEPTLHHSTDYGPRVDGTIVGGALLHIHGSDFSAAADKRGYLTCQFSEVTQQPARNNNTHNFTSVLVRRPVHYTPAKFLAADHVVCASPAHYPGDLEVTLSNNALDFVKPDPFNPAAKLIMTHVRADVHYVVPTHGPQTYATTVLIHGLNFPNSRNMTCTAGSFVAVAVWIHPQLLSCELGPHEFPGSFELLVSVVRHPPSPRTCCVMYQKSHQFFLSWLKLVLVGIQSLLRDNFLRSLQDNFNLWDSQKNISGVMADNSASRPTIKTRATERQNHCRDHLKSQILRVQVVN